MAGAGLPGAEPLLRLIAHSEREAEEYDVSPLRQSLGLWRDGQAPTPGGGDDPASSWELGSITLGDPGIGLASPAGRAGSGSEPPRESDEELAWHGRMEACVSRWFRWQLSVLGFGTGREGLGSRFLRVLLFASAVGFIVAPFMAPNGYRGSKWAPPSRL